MAIGEVETAERSSISLRRVLSMQCLIVSTFSILIGVVTTVQFSLGLAKFGGLEYAPRVLALSAVRGLGPGVSAAASLYALLVWTHAQDPGAIRPHLVRAAPWTLGLVVLTTPLATLLVIASGNLVSSWAYGVPWHPVRSSHRIVMLSDVTAAGLSLVENVILSCTFCWFALPIMRRRSWSLMGKLVATWAAFIVIRGLSHLITA